DHEWDEPEMGSLPMPERAVLVELLRLATTTPDDCWFCVWEGYGGLDDQGVEARVRLPQRDYLLRRGPIEAAMDPTPRRPGPGFQVVALNPTPAPRTTAPGPSAPPEVSRKDQSPNLWWPARRARTAAT